MTSSADPATSATPQPITPAVRGALIRYRVIAYVVGVMLLLLVFVAMPLKYFADSPGAMDVIGPAHGFLYMVYLVGTFDLFRRSLRDTMMKDTSVDKYMADNLIGTPDDVCAKVAAF